MIRPGGPSASKRRRRLVLATALSIALAALTLLPSAPATAAPDSASIAPLWLRYPAISPDGKRIAFIFHGHLFTVPRSGGTATALTHGKAHETAPVWAPDSRRIAFASDQHGNYDVFVADVQGGAPLRLTAYSTDDIPTAFTPDGQSVLFSAHRTDSAASAKYPASFLPELYKAPLAEGRAPTLVLSTPALDAHYDRQGRRLLYEDVKGVEDTWRKHETFANAHKLFVFDAATNRYTQLPTDKGENRNPQWAPDQASIYYLSERSGSSNVWRQSLAKGAVARQITHFSRNPVRFLSVADDKTLCFGFDGEIYTLAPGDKQPVKLAVRIDANEDRPPIEMLHLKTGATEMALSPTGREIAIIVRGDIFVVSTETGVTRRITNTPAQERGVAFSPDGRRLAFAAEYGRPWGLYEAGIGAGDSGFATASAITIHPLLATDHETVQPRYSPDSREIAFLEDRATLKVMNLASHTTRLILPGSLNYSTDDGDQWFEWSPDGRRFLVNYLDLNRWSKKAGLIDASGHGALLNLTGSGFEEVGPRWSPDGQSALWISDKYGLHGAGYDAEFNGDVLAMFFSRDAFDRFNLSSAELKTNPAPPAHPVEALDLGERSNRTARLTLGSSNVVDARLTTDGERLIYVVRGPKGVEVWALALRDKGLKRLTIVDAKPGDDAPVTLALSVDDKTGYLLATGKLTRIDLVSGVAAPLAFDAEKQVDGPAERAWLFDHVWRLQKNRFFDAHMNGVDWDYYRTVYSRFLPFIDNDEDFAELCSEMVGELNASHLGCKFKRDSGDETAALGAFYDPDYRGPGMRIEALVAQGPLSGAGVATGTIIAAIDGQAIEAGADPSLALNHKAGKRITLDLIDPIAQRHRQITVKPISVPQEQALLYGRWVQSRRAEVDRLSGGKVGYVHLRAMNNSTYREVFDDAFGRDSGKAALLIDTRYNHGGHMRDDMITLLSGGRYLHYVPRGRSIGWDPVAPVGKWAGKTAMLVNEDNYSDGHLFAWTYRHLGLGKLIGMPIPGTGTSAIREAEQNPHITIGLPHGAVEDTKGIVMERVQIEPDIRIANTPEALARGVDLQLERATASLGGRP